MSRVLFVVLLILATFPAYVCSQSCSVRANAAVKGSPVASPLVHAVRSGTLGDGIVKPWMKALTEAGIREVYAEVDFNTKDSRVRYEIQNVDFYGDYYTYAKKITLSSADYKRVLDEIQVAILSDAFVTLSTLRPHWERRGTIYVILLDDPCLPIIPPMPTVRD